MYESILIALNTILITTTTFMGLSVVIGELQIRKVNKKLDEMREKRYSEDTPLKTGNL